MMRNSFLFFGSSLLFLILAEFLISFAGLLPNETRWYEMDARLGWRHRANVRGEQNTEGGSTVRTTGLGLRGGEVSRTPRPDAYRIAVLGDSFVESFEVSEEDSFLSIAERELQNCARLGNRRAEVLNFGVRGYGTPQELLVLTGELPSYQPDVVVLGFFAGNDLYNNHPLLNPTNPEIAPYYLPRSESFTVPFSGFSASLLSLRNASSVLQLLWRTVSPWQGSPARARQEQLKTELGSQYQDWLVYAVPGVPEMEQSWTMTEALLEMFRNITLRQGRKALLLLVPGAIELHPDVRFRESFQSAFHLESLSRPEERLLEIARSNDLPAISLRERLDPLVRREKIYLYGFPNTRLGIGHWNENGHREVGRILAEEICRGVAEK